MLKKRKLALMESASRFLEEGETPKEICITQTFATPLLYLLVGPLVLIFVAKQRAVMATDRNVYVLALNFWKAKQVDEMLLKRPLAEATGEQSALSLRIDGGPKLYPMLGAGDDKRKVMELVGA